MPEQAEPRGIPRNAQQQEAAIPVMGAMNLIGHLACAAELPQAVQLGSVLPDLLPLYDRRLRVPALMKRMGPRFAADIDTEDVVRGVRFHLHVDSRFHRHPLFTDGYQGIKAALNSASQKPGLRRMLPAHVLHEMHLDHLLLQDDSQIAERFYRLIDHNREAILCICGLHPAVESQGVAAFLDRVVNDRFVDDYEHLDGLFYRMGRILSRYRQRPLEREEEHSIRDYMHAEERRIRPKLHAFIADARLNVTPEGHIRNMPPIDQESGAEGAVQLAANRHGDSHVMPEHRQG